MFKALPDQLSLRSGHPRISDITQLPFSSRKIMKNNLSLLVGSSVLAAGLSLGAVAPANAQASLSTPLTPGSVSCSDSTFSFSACAGSFVLGGGENDVLGNGDPLLSLLNGSEFDGVLSSLGLENETWLFGGKEDVGGGKTSQAATTDFDITYSGSDPKSGGWSFDSSVVNGPFALSLKSARSFSVYFFEGLDDFDGTWDTLGLQTPNGKAGPGLSHASLFYVERTVEPPVETVPEPAAMAGLLAVGAGIVVNRRKKAQEA
jgi:hypothetical protein